MYLIDFQPHYSIVSHEKVQLISHPNFLKTSKTESTLKLPPIEFFFHFTDQK